MLSGRVKLSGSVYVCGDRQQQRLNLIVKKKFPPALSRDSFGYQRVEIKLFFGSDLVWLLATIRD